MPTLTEPRRIDTASNVREIRTRPLVGSDFAVRATDAGKRFGGHAAVFNSRTSIGNPLGWGWYEEVGERAFDKTLDEGDARLLVDHDSRLLVARVSAGDLRLATDGVGLAVDADLDEELSYVRDLARNLERRRITGMSFGFYVVKDEWSSIDVETKDGNSAQADLRVISEVRLLEVSAVTFPAYEDTDAGLRKVADEIRSSRLSDHSPATGETEPPAGTRNEPPVPPAGTQAAVALLARHTDLAGTHRTRSQTQ